MACVRVDLEFTGFRDMGSSPPPGLPGRTTSMQESEESMLVSGQASVKRSRDMRLLPPSEWWYVLDNGKPRYAVRRHVSFTYF